MNNPDDARARHVTGSGGASGEHPRENPDAAWRAWLASPPGQYLLRWEEEQLAQAVANIFGYYAVQIGMPELDALRASRMPHRIHVALGTAPVPAGAWQPELRVGTPSELPLDTHSIDLVVLPHQLECCADPHQLLREVDRVLRPDGHLIVLGMNPWSLWGLRQSLPAGLLRSFAPSSGPWISAAQLRDWIRLLSFEPDHTRYGCYAWPLRREEWLQRSSRLMERAGDRFWPVCGAVYLVPAIKRVCGMRLVGRVWQPVRVRNRAVVTAVGQRCGRDASGAGERSV